MLERLWRPLVWHALAVFDRRYRYDSAYLRELFDANPRAFFQFSKVITASRFHEGVPAACGFAARFVATRHEGCGACAQLMLAMAAEAGVERAVLQALIDDDPAAMGDEAALG